MRSMTGFGSAQRSAGALTLRAEVRSVNHKFLQLKLRLPGELALLESDVEELVRTRPRALVSGSALNTPGSRANSTSAIPGSRPSSLASLVISAL